MLQALYFDGRIDKTLYIETSEDGKKHRRVRQEDHLSLIQEPGSKYIGHIKPLSGKAVDIANSILEYMTEKNISLSELVCVGCDGCPTNIGKNNGVISILEKKLGRPLQWVVCQLHANELPLRHLFECLDGETSGPSGYSGPIGQVLVNCHKLPPVKFRPIKSPVEELFPDLKKELSTDQKYMFDICRIVSVGECPPGFGDGSPGMLNHARWVTTANRILRLYIASDSPSQTLKEMTNYVVKVYAPSWFTIKCNPKLKDGANNLWKMIQFSSYMQDKHKKVVYNCLQNNGYFAHPENVIVAMLTDSRKTIRQLAIRRIMAARNKSNIAESACVRQFKIPKINFSATDYIDMILLQSINVTEPPVTMHLSEEDLNRIQANGVSDISKITITHSSCRKGSQRSDKVISTSL